MFIAFSRLASASSGCQQSVSVKEDLSATFRNIPG
jgi:hypothetical protein